MKKSLLLTIVVMMMTFLMKAQESGQCGDNLTWYWNINDSTLTIAGTGDMWNNPSFILGHHVHTSHTLLKHLVIEEGVTSIGTSAFEMHIYLRDVSLPNTLISIGDYAFNLCVNLHSIEIPNSVTTIGKSTFSSTKIELLTLGNSVSSIGEFAFSENHFLKHVVISNSLKTIHVGAFYNCKNLKSVDFGNSLVSIGAAAFQACSLTSVCLPETLQLIGDVAFAGNNLTSVTIGAVTPPTCGEINFDQNTYEQATLFVPIGCRSVYENANIWKEFVNIVESGELINDNLSDNISVFPNPSSDFININCKNMKSIEILSMDGKIIRKISISGDYVNVDISDLQSRIYIVMIKTEETCLIKKIVKK